MERRAASLERELSDLVNEAYGLTPEEVDLLWKTAPDAKALSIETTDYFRRSVMEDSDRADISVEMCERVVSAAEYTNQQENGLWQIWGSLSIKLLTGPAGVVGEVMGEDLNENVVLHRDDAGKLYEIEVVGSASKVFDLSRLEVEGLPIGAAPASRQQSKAI